MNALVSEPTVTESIHSMKVESITGTIKKILIQTKDDDKMPIELYEKLYNMFLEALTYCKTSSDIKYIKETFDEIYGISRFSKTLVIFTEQLNLHCI